MVDSYPLLKHLETFIFIINSLITVTRGSIGIPKESQPVGQVLMLVPMALS